MTKVRMIYSTIDQHKELFTYRKEQFIQTYLWRHLRKTFLRRRYLTTTTRTIPTMYIRLKQKSCKSNNELRCFSNINSQASDYDSHPRTPPQSSWYVSVFRKDFTFSGKHLIFPTGRGIFYRRQRCWRPLSSSNIVAILYFTKNKKSGKRDENW